MAESTLAVQLSDLQEAVGRYLGFGNSDAAPTSYPFANAGSGAQKQVDHCIKAGVRQFYFPRLAPGEPIAHVWSFLTPEAQLVTTANVGTYDLPDDFGGMFGEMTYQPGDSTFLTIKRTGIGEIKRLVQQVFGLTGKPTKYATFPKKTDGALGQRDQISFALIPDATYTLDYRYFLLPNALLGANPWPYGGAEHGETLIESCLAVAEARLQDELTVHRDEYKELLLASIAVDVRDHKPENYGQNLDRSDWTGTYPWGRDWGPGQGQWDIAGVTVNGVQY